MASTRQGSRQSTRDRFTDAVRSLVDQVKHDRSILAAILCGSLSHDTVWEKSDVDLVFVTIDDRKVAQSDVALNADGVNVHAFLMPRGEFRRTVEGALHNSFIHAFLTKGTLLYTHDDTIAELCAQLHEIGERDTKLQLLRAATHVLPPFYKARKWFVTRGDLEYTALWILYSATALARIEVISARLIADREVIPQAMKLNPEFFKTIYADLLNEKKTGARVQAAIDAIDAYMAERAPKLFQLVIDYLREIGETRSSRELEDHFQRSFDVGGITTACEYLADQGLIGKAATPLYLTKRSNVAVQELAFFALDSR